MQTDATLGEIFLKAFVLRRVHLISHSVGDTVLIGSSNSADTLHLRDFLIRNGHPHSYNIWTSRPIRRYKPFSINSAYRLPTFRS
jgi:hypothetical protein